MEVRVLSPALSTPSQENRMATVSVRCLVDDVDSAGNPFERFKPTRPEAAVAGGR